MRDKQGAGEYGLLPGRAAEKSPYGHVRRISRNFPSFCGQSSSSSGDVVFLIYRGTETDDYLGGLDRYAKRNEDFVLVALNYAALRPTAWMS